MSTCAVHSQVETVCPILANVELITLELRNIEAEENPAKLTFDNGHLYLIDKVAKVGGGSRAVHCIIFQLITGVIGSTSEGTTRVSSTFVPIVGVVLTQWVVKHWTAARGSVVDTLWRVGKSGGSSLLLGR